MADGAAHIIQIVKSRTESASSPPFLRSAHSRQAPVAPLKREPVVTRRALALCGWPEQLDREIKEREQTEKLLSAEYPELFGG